MSSNIIRARDNPFAVDRVLQVRYRLLCDSWEELLGKLNQLQFRAAIVGPEGRGKTTLQEDLAKRLLQQGHRVSWLRLNRQHRKLSKTQWQSFFDELTADDLVFLDGAEQLSRWTWRWFRRRMQNYGGLVITSHRAGLLPTLIDCQTTPDLLEDIVTQLVSKPSVQLQETTRLLYSQHHGNLRDALRELYDLYAEGYFVHQK